MESAVVPVCGFGGGNTRSYTTRNTNASTIARIVRRSGVRKSLERLGDGIVAAGVEWMTPGDPPDGEPAPAPRSVPLERFQCVGRTRWIITAGRRQQRREAHLIQADQPDERSAHDVCEASTALAVRRRRGRGRGIGRGHGNHSTRSSTRCQRSVAIRSTRVVSSDMPIRYADGIARTTTSALRAGAVRPRHRGRTRRRTSSRNRRLSRFRSTAVCLYFGTTNPTRDSLRSVMTTRTSKSSTRILVPARRTC